ncbi:MAG: hypothetical protein JJU35_07010 [Balneolales bacterium]|nr:hypothetical protein [Balneolales bacterium]
MPYLLSLLLPALLFSGLSVPPQDVDSDDPDTVIIRGLWRSGEMARFELTETVRIFEEGQLSGERQQSTLVHVDVAARTPGQRYVLIWQMLESNAVLFGDPALDQFMHSLIADGIVIETDGYGGIRQSTNMSDIFGHFKNAALELDEANHWTGREPFRQQLQLYLDDESLFESLLMRDIRFMFGLHGVELRLDQVFEYQTWQENPWGAATESTGRLFIEDYDEARQILTVVNEVRLPQPLPEGHPVLEETQRYDIQARTGWLQEVWLTDVIDFQGIRRERELHIQKVPF